jgi:hypothetical protein
MVLDLLPLALRPFAKFIGPAALTFLAALIGLSTGAADSTTLEIALVGLAAACSSFIVENGPVGLRAYAKALAPAALTATAVLAHWAVSGTFDHAEWTMAVTGFGAALTSLLLPNEQSGRPWHPAATTETPLVIEDTPLLPDETSAELAEGQARAATVNPPLVPEARA